MKTKVIIIDDHQLFNDGLNLILKESANFRVIGQVYDSREAYFQCHKLQPELVLVDFNMPNLDGLEVVKEFKSLGFSYKIVVISMYADSKEIAMFKEAGVDGYITKTTPVKELIESLNKIMRGEMVFESFMEKKTTNKKDGFILKYQFTKRELEILKALKKGYSTEQTAEELHLSYYTVETHRKNINQKLKFKTKKEFYDFLNASEFVK